MKRVSSIAVCLIVLFIQSTVLMAEDLMAQGNVLYDMGQLNFVNYRQSGNIFAKALERNPASYEAAWKAARSYREFANECKLRNVPDWKVVCKEYGKFGMKYGEKAIALNGTGVEGNCWYGLSVGIYSDSVSVLTAYREGLKDKAQSSFEKAYKADKKYNKGSPIKALGRFWFVLPWPLQDNKLSLQYLREFRNSFPNDAEGQIFLTETLRKTGGKEEAKVLLQKVAGSPDQYYADWARRLLYADWARRLASSRGLFVKYVSYR